MSCSLQKSFYSGRDGCIIPLSISMKNPKQKKIQSVITQLIQMVSLNGIKYENEIFTIRFDQITQENQILELNLPSNIPPTYIPNENGQPDNLPAIVITYEFRLIAQINDGTTPNLHLTVPIGIE
jgi:hypothetical protein